MHSLKQRDGRTALNMCTCGKLHFSYGSITIHFGPDEFASFAGAVAHLYAQYRQIHNARQPSSIPSFHTDACH